MILGIGIDSIEIDRLIPWTQFPHPQLLRVFHAEELAYCFQNPTRTAERLAARFAAREAFFKALAQHCIKPLPFLTLCKIMQVKNQPSGAPELIVNWDYLNTKGYVCFDQSPNVHISLTHTHTQATAIIIIETP